MNTTTKKYSDSLTMTKRCLLLSKRNPDTLFTSIILPALMMLLFVSLFGNLIHVGDTSYVNYIVPGVLLQCIAQCSSTTGIMLNGDVTKGIVHRFSTLPIKKSALITGHVLTSIVRNILTSTIVLLVAALMGFRPSADFLGWCIVLVLLIGIITSLSWFSVIVGLISKTPEGAGGLSALLVILPYLSSGFVPTESLPRILQIFAKYQPMTPMIDSMRNVLLGNALDTKTLAIALVWCFVLTVVFYSISLVLFKGRLSK